MSLRPARRRRCRIGPGASATGMWAFRRRDRWTICHSAWLTGSSATRPAPPALKSRFPGPTLKFNVDALICIAGAAASASIDGRAVSYYTPTAVRAGETLSVGTAQGTGARIYIAVRGGIAVPSYLGSAATFTLGRFGGHGGRALLAGDVLHLGDAGSAPSAAATAPLAAKLVPASCASGRSGFSTVRTARPTSSPTTISRHSSRLPGRFTTTRTGPACASSDLSPQWARADGGEAGLHPSNIHDNAYAIGAVDFTGDMPVVLGPDGPSLGGFVCPATIVAAELWKMGQLRAGDKVRFKRLSPAEAYEREARQIAEIETLAPIASVPRSAAGMLGADDCIVGVRAASEQRPRVVYRRAGDKYLLIEYGPIALDLELRFRVHMLMTALEKRDLDGVVDLTPGIRSLQVHYDSRALPLATLLEELGRIEDAMGDNDAMELPSRIVHMPLSWDDAATQLAIEKYMQSVRADAPWCPSNIEFIRRINGLESIEDVKKIVFDASYLVLGLGDVYLGAPVATPVDPRHRLVTTKYNPARTWTPENAVGIGGAYLCVYGMEGPGGYQFVGRTCQVWNTYRTTSAFVPGSPWLLRFFDQIRFYPVSAEELLAFRDSFLDGRVALSITPASFSLKDYRAFLAQNADDIGAFKSGQQAAFEAERGRWQSSDRAGESVDTGAPETVGEDELAPGMTAVASPVPEASGSLPSKRGRASLRATSLSSSSP